MFHNSATLTSIKIIKKANTAKLISMFRKTQIKLIRCDSHIWLNVICKKELLTPNYIKWSRRNFTPSASQAIAAARRTWLNSEIRKWYSVKNNLRIHMKVMHLELSYRLHQVEFEIIDKESKVLCLQESEVMRKKKLKKLYVLKRAQRCFHHEDDVEATKFFPRLVNKTELNFTTEEKSLLEHGLKYSPIAMVSKKDYENLAVDTDIGASNCDFSVKMLCANTLNKGLTNFNQNKFRDRKESKILMNLKQKIESNNLICTKADKGNTLVILHKTEYVDKVNNFIEDSGAIETIRNPTNKFQANLKNAIKKCPNILGDHKWGIIEMNPQAPILYGPMKLHKEDHPIRPVVSYSSAPAYKICKIFNKVFSELTQFKSTFSIKNSIDLIKKLENMETPPNSVLVSFDVKNLFPSIPISELKNIILDKINSKIEDDNIKQELTVLADIVLNQNYFQFNNKFYVMPDGLAMGSPFSPLGAEIFMNNLEEKIFNSGCDYRSHLVFWHRYVDDVLALWNGPNELLTEFLEWLNQLEPSINFTIEKEIDGQINFLDLYIRRIDNRLTFNIYRKPSYTDVIIPANSNHPTTIKLSSFHSMINRLFDVPLSSNDFNVEVDTIKTIARNNGYSVTLIDRLIRNKYKKVIRKEITRLTPIDEPIKKFVKLPFIGKTSIEIGNILKQNCNVKIAFYNNNIIKNKLINAKGKIDRLNKSGIYKIKCDDCNSIYIGQTGRDFKKRFQEHIAACKNVTSNSALAKHLILNKHNCSIDNLKVLHVEKKGKKLDILENLEIEKANRKGSRILNEQIDFSLSFSPILKQLLYN